MVYWRFLNIVFTLERKQIQLTKMGHYCSPVINVLFLKAVKYFPGVTVKISGQNSAKYNGYSELVL